MFEVNPAWGEDVPVLEISDLSDEELYALMELDARRVGANCKDEFAPISEMAVCDTLSWMGNVPVPLYPNRCS